MCQASPVVYSSELATQGCGLDEDQAQHWLSIKKTQQRATTSQKCKCKCFKNKCHVSKTGHLLFFCKAENKGAAKQANYADWSLWTSNNSQLSLLGLCTYFPILFWSRYLTSLLTFQYYFLWWSRYSALFTYMMINICCWMISIKCMITITGNHKIRKGILKIHFEQPPHSMRCTQWGVVCVFFVDSASSRYEVRLPLPLSISIFAKRVLILILHYSTCILYITSWCDGYQAGLQYLWKYDYWYPYGNEYIFGRIDTSMFRYYILYVVYSCPPFCRFCKWWMNTRAASLDRAIIGLLRPPTTHQPAQINVRNPVTAL